LEGRGFPIYNFIVHSDSTHSIMFSYLGNLIRQHLVEGEYNQSKGKFTEPASKRVGSREV
jgi:hypothetical protein